MVLSLLCHLASAIVGAVIPVFYSYKTIKRPSQKSLSYWSKYWAVFGSFLAVDAVLSSLFIHYFVPFYEFGKLLFLIWAVSPQTAGAQFIFDKVLAPFIRRHEKKMDVYVERMIENVVQRGPDLAITAGNTLVTVARNLHALSQIRADSQGRLCYPMRQSIEIAEIDDEPADQVPLNALKAPPVCGEPVEVKLEPLSDDEVILVPVQDTDDRSRSASSKTPLPAKRKRGRRPGSAVTRRGNRKQQQPVEDRVNEELDVVGVTKIPEIAPPSKRRHNTRAAAAAARKQLIIVGADDSTSEA